MIQALDGGIPTSSLARNLCLSSLIAGLDEGRKDMLRCLAKLAEESEVSIYLVGGPVRDALLRSPVVDLDFSVVGDGVAVANRFAQETGGCITVHPQFGTASVVTGRCRVDLVTARSEEYPEAGSLPGVTPGSIEEDLARRDFTINAMAMRVWPEGEGILDPTGGLDDLESGTVRALHSQSFMDDPTRMFRAVRYEQRFGFRIDDETLLLISSAVSRGCMDAVSGDRWLHEIERILDEPDPGRVLLRASELGLLPGLHPSLADDSGICRMAECDDGHVGREEWLAALFSPLSEADGSAVIRRLRLSGRWAMVARDTINLRDMEKAIRESSGRPSGLYRILSPFAPQAIAARTRMTGDPFVRRALQTYLDELRFIRPSLNGDDLLAMGAAQGPLVGEILAHLHRARLDGDLSDIVEERAMARELLTPGRPESPFPDGQGRERVTR